jgi:hypothetical protein
MHLVALEAEYPAPIVDRGRGEGGAQIRVTVETEARSLLTVGNRDQRRVRFLHVLARVAVATLA